MGSSEQEHNEGEFRAHFLRFFLISVKGRLIDSMLKNLQSFKVKKKTCALFNWHFPKISSSQVDKSSPLT